MSGEWFNEYQCKKYIEGKKIPKTKARIKQKHNKNQVKNKNKYLFRRKNSDIAI